MKACLTRTLLTAGALLVASPGLAQDSAGQPGTTPDAAVEPAAVEALEAMGRHLRGLGQFRLSVATSVDDVVEGGQVIETAGSAVYDVRSPDRFRAQVRTDKSERVFYYDGSTVTQFAPALGFYAVFEAAPTIAETIDLAHDKYDVELPLADLFYWGTERSSAQTLTGAFWAGEARVLGETCNHYAFRSDLTDFQVWIRKHGDPLPCRMVIVTTDDEARPRYAATFEWDLDPLLGDTLFTFAPPPGAEKIGQEQIAAEAN